MKVKDLITEKAVGGALAHEHKVADFFASKGGDVWQAPLGADTSFPDVGVSFDLPSGSVKLFVEIKNAKSAQLGSVRNWTFDGNQFSATDHSAENTDLVVSLLNQNEQAKQNAKEITRELQALTGVKDKILRAGFLNSISDKMERYKALKNYVDHRVKDTMVARIRAPFIGQMVVNHYLAKFNEKASGENNLLVFVIGNELFIVPTGNMPSEQTINELAQALGVKVIPQFPKTFDGALEARVQPRHMSKQGREPVRLDTMANLRGNLTGIVGAKLAI